MLFWGMHLSSVANDFFCLLSYFLMLTYIDSYFFGPY